MSSKNLTVDEQFLEAYTKLTEKFLLVQDKMSTHIVALTNARHFFELANKSYFVKYQSIIIPGLLIMVVTIAIVVLNKYNICGKAGYDNLFLEIKCQ